jgi:hypothetical protein
VTVGAVSVFVVVLVLTIETDEDDNSLRDNNSWGPSLRRSASCALAERFLKRDSNDGASSRMEIETRTNLNVSSASQTRARLGQW